jgi:HK97 family phage prohead protease
MSDPFISGYAIQWNQPAIIGGAFEERFARGSFDKSLRENPDVACLWSHDSSRVLGRSSNGTLKLQPDAIGLHYVLTPNKESPIGQEALASVGRGDVGEVSVGFWSEIEEWDDRGDMPRRLITQARLLECSLVLWGAYGKATSAALSRSSAAATAARRVRAKAEAAMRLRGIAV